MYIFDKLIGSLRRNRHADIDPAEAYDLWSEYYDEQPGNLMLDLDEKIFNLLLDEVILTDKSITDIGCGTGRHWKKIMSFNPLNLTGYDVSAGMLEKLKMKFPEADTHLLKDNLLPELKNESCDIIISTLTIAHIANLEEAFNEWKRVLKNTGEIIITDFHPELLEKGGKRTFLHEGKTVSVKNHIHTMEKIQSLSRQMNWELVRLEERKIDDSVKHFYEKQDALDVFEQFKGLPVIFGMHLKSKYVTS